jgi:hypothetical protein
MVELLRTLDRESLGNSLQTLRTRQEVPSGCNGREFRPNPTQEKIRVWNGVLTEVPDIENASHPSMEANVAGGRSSRCLRQTQHGVVEFLRS